MSQTLPPQPVSRREMLAPHRIVRLALAALGVALFAGLIIWEVLRVTTAPLLIVSSPADNLVTDSHQITLVGRAAAGVTVTANGAAVAVSLDGHFNEEMDLRTGENVITIVASKKFAKPNIIYRRVIVNN